MINSWRSYWEDEFPFYYVQIAPFNYGTPLRGAMVREAQLKSMKTKNTGMVVISDIGDLYDIHPRNKIDVGARLANWALRYHYGVKDINPSGPLYNNYEVEGSSVKLFFSYANGMYFEGDPTLFFEIASRNGYFQKATDVEIAGNHIIVSHKDISDPVAVRYAFKNLSEGNLFNSDNLPASSFRTDAWPIYLEIPKIEISRKLEGMEVKSYHRKILIKCIIPLMEACLTKGHLHILGHSRLIKARPSKQWQ